MPPKSWGTFWDELLRIAPPLQLVRRFLDCEDALALVQRPFDSSRIDGPMEFSPDALDSISTYLSRLGSPPRTVLAHAVSMEKQ